MKPPTNPELQAELAALKQRIAELELHEAELAWAHETLLEQVGREHSQTVTALRLSEEKLSRILSERKHIEQVVLEQNRMLEAVSEAQADFIMDADPHPTFERLLSHLLDITDSQYGFICEACRENDAAPFLRPYAISNVSWDEASHRLYEKYIRGGFELRNLETLFGHVLTSGRPVLSSNPASDPRSGGLPPGHPPLHAFMGLPLYRASELVGMLGVANRPDGYSEDLVEHLQPFTTTCAVLIEAYRQSQQRQHAENLLRRLNAELEDHVSQRTAELQASIRELESFSYSVSHDLRSPLRGINGFSRLLLEDYGDRLDEHGREYLRRICAATLRMSDLIDGMIDLAQLTREPLRIAEVDLSRLAESVARDLQGAEPERRVAFTAAPDVRVRGDERLLRVVLLNLLSNAWKFTARSEMAQIEFGMKRTGNALACYVRDDGAGFDMKYADKLFGAFQRLHGVKEFAGTGIGLATVQRIVQRHGGLVWAEGEVGKGATFYFTLS